MCEQYKRAMNGQILPCIIFLLTISVIKAAVSVCVFILDAHDPWSAHQALFLRY